MSSRAKRRRQKLLSSLWPLPVLAVAGGTGLALALSHLDAHAFLHDFLANVPVLAPVLEVKASDAQGILGTIAGALATVLGVLFSITIVALQLASSQYSPRVLRRFRGDRISQVVLASLLGTVALLVVVLPGMPQEAHPRLTLLCALSLTLLCLCLVAFFLHHLARMIDTATIVRHIRLDTVAMIHQLKLRPFETTQIEGEGSPITVRADGAGYLEACDEEVIFSALPSGVHVMRVEARAGDFIIPGLPLLLLWPGGALDEERHRQLRTAFPLAQQRTLEQDVLFGVRQLVDVGLKALSAAINDVTTAVMAVNELGLILHAFQTRNPAVDDGWRHERRGACTLAIPVLGLRSLLRHSFDEIARAAGPQLRVGARMLEVMEQVIEATRPDEAQRAAYAQAGRWIESSARQEGATSVERDYFDERYRSLLRRAAGVTLPDEEPALH